MKFKPSKIRRSGGLNLSVSKFQIRATIRVLIRIKQWNPLKSSKLIWNRKLSRLWQIAISYLVSHRKVLLSQPFHWAVSEPLNYSSWWALHRAFWSERIRPTSAATSSIYEAHSLNAIQALQSNAISLIDCPVDRDLNGIFQENLSDPTMSIPANKRHHIFFEWNFLFCHFSAKQFFSWGVKTLNLMFKFIPWTLSPLKQAKCCNFNGHFQFASHSGSREFFSTKNFYKKLNTKLFADKLIFIATSTKKITNANPIVLTLLSWFSC